MSAGVSQALHEDCITRFERALFSFFYFLRAGERTTWPRLRVVFYFVQFAQILFAVCPLPTNARDSSGWVALSLLDFGFSHASTMVMLATVVAATIYIFLVIGATLFCMLLYAKQEESAVMV